MTVSDDKRRPVHYVHIDGPGDNTSCGVTVGPGVWHTANKSYNAVTCEFCRFIMLLKPVAPPGAGDEARPPSVLTTEEFAKALEAAGVISDLDTTQRIIIDLKPGHLVTIHVQRDGDKRLIDLASMLTGAAHAKPAAMPDVVHVMPPDHLISQRTFELPRTRRKRHAAWEAWKSQNWPQS